MTTRELHVTQPRLSWYVRLLLGGYPPWWRLRYDDEMRDTLLAMQEEGHWRARDSKDLLRGLVEAWLNPTIVPSQDPMTDSTRALIPRTAWGLLLFILAGAGFSKAIDDPAITAATQSHPAIGWCLDVVIGAAVAVAVVMAACTVPYLRAIMGRDGRQAWRTLAPLVVVPVSVAVWAVTLVVARNVADGTALHRPSHVVAFLALAAVTVLGGVCSTTAALRVATRAPETRGVALSRRVAMVAIGALTALCALAVTGWIVAVAVETPELLRADNGLIATPTLPSLAVIVVALASAAVLCGRSGVRVLSSRSTAPRSTR